jgi:hypothetical protein
MSLRRRGVDAEILAKSVRRGVVVSFEAAGRVGFCFGEEEGLGWVFAGGSLSARPLLGLRTEDDCIAELSRGRISSSTRLR